MSSKARGHNEPDWGFEWPPKQRLVPSEVVELDQSAVDRKPPAVSQQMGENPLLEFNARSPLPLPLPVRLPELQPAASLPEQPQGAPAAGNGIVREELPAEVQEELRGLDADFWGPIALENYLKRGWIMPTAIVVLALVAVVEGMLLFRARSVESDAVSEFSSAAPHPAESSTPAQQPTRANAPPTPTTSYAAPQTSANRATAANDAALGRNGAPPRQTQAVQPATPAPAVAPPDPPVRAPGWITISAPIELNVSEKETLLGTTRGPRILLSPGGHVLQLENPMFGYRENQWVRIHPGRETTLPLSLPEGLVHINATPWADISIDGKSFGQTPIGNLKLTIGSHAVVFRHPQLGEKTVSAVVKVGVPTRVSADLTQE